MPPPLGDEMIGIKEEVAEDSDRGSTSGHGGRRSQSGDWESMIDYDGYSPQGMVYCL